MWAQVVGFFHKIPEAFSNAIDWLTAYPDDPIELFFAEIFGVVILKPWQFIVLVLLVIFSAILIIRLFVRTAKHFDSQGNKDIWERKKGRSSEEKEDR